MELITTEEIKDYLSKRADECGYTFDKDNPYYQNLARLEALRAHYFNFIEETSTLHSSLKPTARQRVEVEKWLEEFEINYIENKAPTVAKHSGAMVTKQTQKKMSSHDDAKFI
ncbi:hypothetical protein ABMY12_20595 [Vibrio vulnificus]|uniref:hypothetical protein n=1 Tax=Vibrio vulnificus TaxID=672 RepID=UPI0040584F2C